MRTMHASPLGFAGAT